MSVHVDVGAERLSERVEQIVIAAGHSAIDLPALNDRQLLSLRGIGPAALTEIRHSHPYKPRRALERALAMSEHPDMAEQIRAERYRKRTD